MSTLALIADQLPTPKEERWKYTNLEKGMPAGLSSVEEEEIVIHIPRGQVCDHIRDISVDAAAGSEKQIRLKIVLEQGAQLTIHENQMGSGAYWKNMTTDIELGAGAILHHIRVLDDAREALHTNLVYISAARDAVYNGFALNIGAGMCRHDMHAALNGENAEVSFNGLNLLNGDQHGDTTILIEHAAPHCRSNQFYRSLLNDRARCVFQGKVHVHQVAQKTDGYQLSNAILLSDKAEMNVKPELEIYADDVLCSHGSTCGQLDEEPLFYLRSRGLSEMQARLLLIEAFVAEVLDKIDDEGLRSQAAQKVDQWLSAALL